MQHQSTSTVAILLSTYNGAAYLPEQLDSLAAQTCRDWVIYASDDGSQDDTVAILHDYQRRLGKERLVILKGPRQGFAANFLATLKHANGRADFFAFCDQDDFWEPEKLERGLSWAQRQEEDLPALYCSRTRLIDAEGRAIGYSPLFRRAPSFANALVQSIAGGNTMLFNARTAALLCLTPQHVPIISHDWWAYIVVTGCGGEVHYDEQPSIGYRQHGNNLIGSNSSVRDRLVRLQRMLKGTFRHWNDVNLDAISHLRHHLTSENQRILELFGNARRAPLHRKLQLISQSGVYRQTLPGNLGLVAATLIQRL
ncbi:glycosyltransferase family 2 protein [Pseudomonas sp. ZM23]|uniref:Glycosyltransferase family 2 protein n=1 Tax=Pseudomonas triclosanedens TaxID=2961893 RepID=A0ABY6ZWZ6_9PSED|nr:glycosyltransferase family 2 protein [Pseudomonas triclosanedens]MCP8466749.1 glycosyltransferase family 2 protein [Pseudomonas triclosanedens]MCP8469973.1 glycosyltransferase family 2 protein [Pseudomonas triclosanedens]MCP8477883.1 glycosyltransferase family 2 protein [Pseudomonas triclosanedens]WAI49304.1 glycosyltransferase family 2 protein [Pseudomonas triclosanedens]